MPSRNHGNYLIFATGENFVVTPKLHIRTHALTYVCNDSNPAVSLMPKWYRNSLINAHFRKPWEIQLKLHQHHTSIHVVLRNLINCVCFNIFRSGISDPWGLELAVFHWQMESFVPLRQHLLFNAQQVNNSYILSHALRNNVRTIYQDGANFKYLRHIIVLKTPQSLFAYTFYKSVDDCLVDVVLHLLVRLSVYCQMRIARKQHFNCDGDW